MFTSVVCSTVPLPSGFTFTSVVLLRHAVRANSGEEHAEESKRAHRGSFRGWSIHHTVYLQPWP